MQNKWLKAAAPTFIFIVSLIAGIKFGFWAQSAIIIAAIAFYAFKGEVTRELLQQQFMLLILYSAIMAYASLTSWQTFRKIEAVCEEEDRSDDDQCSRILWEIHDGGRDYYAE